jgi:formylmethanofuran dehydrogenase subunit E
MRYAETFAARAILAEQDDRHDAAHNLRMAAIDMGYRYATAPHDPNKRCGECGEPALADGSTLGGTPICGIDLDDYYDEMKARR